MKNPKSVVSVTRTLLAIFCAGIAITLAGCGHRSLPPEQQPITLGSVLPLTGNIAEYGKRCKAGAEYAVSEINASGGINGKQIEIIYEDDAGDPKNGVNAIQKLISVNHVKIVIGAVASSVSLAIEPIATKNNVILFSPASSSPKLTGISPYFFRDWPSDVYEATVLAEFVHNELKLSRVAILYVNNEYGIGLKDEFKRRFLQLGGQVAVIDSYEQNATDLRAQLTKIKDSNPEAIYLAGYHRDMAVATRQIRELGIPAQILADADYGVEELLQIAGSSAEGAIYSIPEYDPKKSEPAKRFSQGFRSRYRTEPSIFEANAYDCVQIIAKAIATVGTDTTKISDFIAGIRNYQGASGDISFGLDREVVKPVAMKQVKDGKFVPYLKKGP